ncbi:hypothetical protein VNO77_22759 [Canavalia gladiata]|uniref:Uncharacterized protein n=1 Tax=Canavalia gladiata TaxID=3824 RepID=A0AAN9L371_CANGL
MVAIAMDEPKVRPRQADLDGDGRTRYVEAGSSVPGPKGPKQARVQRENVDQAQNWLTRNQSHNASRKASDRSRLRRWPNAHARSDPHPLEPSTMKESAHMVVDGSYRERQVHGGRTLFCNQVLIPHEFSF